MNLSNAEKMMLTPILDKAETQVRIEREQHLRSGDLSAQLETISSLTNKLKFIEKLQFYCMEMEVAQ